VDYRTLRFEDYLKPGIAAPPASYDVLDAVYQNLKIKDPTKLFPMDGNDTIGDYTIAALAHAITVYRGVLKTKKIYDAGGCGETALPPDRRTGHRAKRAGQTKSQACSATTLTKGSPPGSFLLFFVSRSSFHCKARSRCYRCCIEGGDWGKLRAL
jgi:hypothetical protein